MPSARLSIAALVTLAGTLALGQESRAAVLISTVDDLPGRGFFDATPATPVGGNDGTTVGQQRANVLARALEVFSRRLRSGQTIRVLANFHGDDLACTPAAAVLGGAASDHAFRYEGPPGSPHPAPGVLYHAALFDRLVNGDPAPDRPDIVASFNGRLGSPGCAEGMTWYHGFDGLGSKESVDLLTVMLHELSHALGFSDFSDRTTGEFPEDSRGNPMPGVFSLFLYDNISQQRWPDLTPEQRLVSRKSPANLLWDGPITGKVSRELPSGCIGSDARMRMFAPVTFMPGSSISHWDTTCTPDLMMEPVFTSRGFLDLTPALLADLGWELAGSCGDGAVDEGEQCDRGADNAQGASCSKVCLASSTAAGTCGDGSIGPGEQCDQGTLNGTAGSCCSSACAPKGAGITCRPTAGMCDVVEVCSGLSGTCPADDATGACPPDASPPGDAGAKDGAADGTPDAPGGDDASAPPDGSQSASPPLEGQGCSCRFAGHPRTSPAAGWLLLALLLRRRRPAR